MSRIHTLSLFIVVVLSFLAGISAIQDYILRETNPHEKRHDYIKLDRVKEHLSHQFVISIHQKNIDTLERMLYDISDMNSVNYGKYLTSQEIGQYVMNHEGTAAVTKWLHDNNVKIIKKSLHGEYIVAESTVPHLETLFQTEFFEFQRNTTLQHHGQGSHLRNNHKKSSVVRGLSYSVPSHLHEHIHGIFRLVSLPNILSYRSKVKKIHPKKVKNEHVHSDLFPGNGYTTPTNLKSHYHIIPDTGTSLGNQSVYASIGSTFLPSDLALFQRNYQLPNHPVDAYVGNMPSNSVCRIPSSPTATSGTMDDCMEASLDVQYMLAVSPSTHTTYWYDDPSDNDFVGFVVDVASAKNPPLVYSISYGIYEYLMTSQEITSFNNEAIKLGLKGVTLVTASGDDGVAGYVFRSQFSLSKCGYYASWPAASPYVTAVGGTMNGLDGVTQEISAAADSGCGITSGGGFSKFNPAPAFQKNAVDAYFQFLPEQPVVSRTEQYNPNNRAYPDVALAANQYVIVVNGQAYTVDGTSASSPVFAGMIALVNSARLKQGKAPLGWLNPAIYASNGQFANDITQGSNGCTATAQRCCTIGFSATAGWDPVTGFGSVDYTKFLNYFMNYNPNSPTSAPTLYIAGQPTIHPTIRPTTHAPVVSPTPAPGDSSYYYGGGSTYGYYGYYAAGGNNSSYYYGGNGTDFNPFTFYYGYYGASDVPSLTPTASVAAHVPSSTPSIAPSIDNSATDSAVTTAAPTAAPSTPIALLMFNTYFSIVSGSQSLTDSQIEVLQEATSLTFGIPVNSVSHNMIVVNSAPVSLNHRTLAQGSLYSLDLIVPINLQLTDSFSGNNPTTLVEYFNTQTAHLDNNLQQIISTKGQDSELKSISIASASIIKSSIQIVSPVDATSTNNLTTLNTFASLAKQHQSHIMMFLLVVLVAVFSSIVTRMCTKKLVEGPATAVSASTHDMLSGASTHSVDVATEDENKNKEASGWSLWNMFKRTSNDDSHNNAKYVSAPQLDNSVRNNNIDGDVAMTEL